MTFTRPWVTAQSGAVNANTIDTLFSNLRVDIEERAEASLFTDMALDPLVLRPEVNGAVTGKIITLAGYSFNINPDKDNNLLTYQTDGSVRIETSAFAARCGIVLPAGITVTRVRWLINNVGTDTVTAKFLSRAFGVGNAPNVLNIQTKSSAGEELISSGAITLPVVSTQCYWFEIDKTAGVSAFYLFGVELQYNTPDSRNTV